MGFLSWLGSGLVQSIVGIFGSAILKPVLDAISHKQDVALEKYKAETGRDLQTDLAMLQAENIRRQGEVNLTMAAMNHPIWWFAWLIFVLPVGVYFALTFLYAALQIPIVLPEVSGQCAEWAKLIVPSIFAAQATTGIVTAISTRLGAREKR